jgi:hypothetical protein
MSNIIKIDQIRNEKYLAEMNLFLSTEEREELISYLENGGHPLSPDTAAKFFELFLNGTNCYDIWKLNKAFPYGAILDARIKFKWDAQKDEYAIRLQNDIKNKVTQAQLETADLMSDMLLAAKKKNSAKLKRYLQTGDEKELEEALNIGSLKTLKDIVEGLMKITGQDKNITVKNINESKQSLDVNITGSINSAAGNGIETLETEDAATILKILADAKRKQTNEK